MKADSIPNSVRPELVEGHARTSTSSVRTEVVNSWLLERLVCPATRTPLRHDAELGELVSDEAGLAYPIRDGVPVLLVEEVRHLR